MYRVILQTSIKILFLIELFTRLFNYKKHEFFIS